MKLLQIIRSIFKFLTSAQKKKLISALTAILARNLMDARKLWILIFMMYTSFRYRMLKVTDPQYALKYSFTRKFSRILGGLTRIKIPKLLRKSIFMFYSRAFKVRVNDIVEPLDSFETFVDFFTRKIHPREVELNPLTVVSPADSKVLCLSEVTKDECVIVKGLEYHLGELLTGIGSYKVTEEVLKTMKKNPDNSLYQIILYLSPGDYHRYHAPCDTVVKSRNHILGKLFPVKENYIMKHPEVYEKNERVCIFGEWEKGYMSMIFVGAMNVGSIVLNFDDELQTNLRLRKPFEQANLKFYGDNDDQETKGKDKYVLSQEAAQSVFKGDVSGVKIKRGEDIGRFKMGSTIVLVFEASPNFEWRVKPGDSVLYGQVLGVSS